MKKARYTAMLLACVLLSANAFAGATAHSTAATSTLSKEQIEQIQKDCSKANHGSMTSTAYKDCVKAKEDEAAAKHEKY
jgi:hypothetical protein